jgi:two-component system LytT family response regulator
MLRAVIIDDEKLGIETLKVLASRNSAIIKVVATTLIPEEGIELIEDYKPDVVFLDISMPTMSGFELLNKLSFRDFKLVFTTAHREYAIEAIKNKAFDYLLKPVDEKDFRKCVEQVHLNYGKVEQSLPIKRYTAIEVNAKDGVVFIKQHDIIRLEASGSYTIFYLDNCIKHVASKGIGEFENKLDQNIFYRCQRSHIINLEKVQKFITTKGFFALMIDGSTPEVSVNNKDEFLNRLKNVK